jgi:serine/threonine protein kinase
VLDAYDPSLDRPVAIKVMRPEFAQEATVVARFQREGKAAAALQHPNIAVVHSVGQERGVPYLVMERVHGPSLREVLGSSDQRSAISSQRSAISSQRSAVSDQPTAFAASPLPADFIRTVFRQLLCGLEAAHACGVIHRDIKPANILLDTSHQPSAVSHQPDSGATLPANAPLPACLDSSLPRCLVASLPSCLVASLPSCLVKIIDFGLARVREARGQVTICGSIFGTPEYMSPEQARGDADVDHRTDLYSVGVVLYEMLTGCTPFKADSATATIHRILHDEPADPREFDKGVDPVLASLALRMMAKRRKERPSSAGQVLAALEADRPLYRLGVGRRVPARAWGTVACAVLLLIVGWVGLQHALRPERIADVQVNSSDQGHAPSTLPGVSRRIDDVRVDPACLFRVQVLYEGRARDDWAPFGESMRHQMVRAVIGDQPGESTDGSVAKIELDSSGRQAIAVGVNPRKPNPKMPNALTHGRCNLLAYDMDGQPLWKDHRDGIDLSVDWRWPNCGPTGPWAVSSVYAWNLDDKPGDELVVVARAGTAEYPTRITVIDPLVGAIKATFWHFGHIEQVQLVPNYLGAEHPALLARGINNKLDGFYLDAIEPRDDGPPVGAEDRAAHQETNPPTDFDYVPVVFILDPQRMNGIGPPRTCRMDPYRRRPVGCSGAHSADSSPCAAEPNCIGDDNPYAYAFLDMASDMPHGPFWPNDPRRRYAGAGWRADITTCEMICDPTQNNQAAFCVRVYCILDAPVRQKKFDDQRSVSYDLDRNLVLLKDGVVAAPLALRTFDIGWWHERWCPIIQSHDYLELPVRAPDQSRGGDLPKD